jgi:hypothetical protein
MPSCHSDSTLNLENIEIRGVPKSPLSFFSIFLIMSQGLPWRKRSMRGAPEVADCLKYIQVQDEFFTKILSNCHVGLIEIISLWVATYDY